MLDRRVSKVHYSIPATKVRQMSGFDSKQYRSLPKIGVHVEDHIIRNMIRHAMDVGPVSGITTPSITTPVQFLQSWLPGFVKIITRARKIDQLVGMSVVGDWKDEQVVQGVMELIGLSVPYGDYTNVPYASWNANFVARTFFRSEEGLRVGPLEEQRAAAIRVDSASERREAAALALEITRNLIGFYGINSGANNTYGFLNDPGLGAYVTVATGASGQTFWSTKTFLEICADIRKMIQAIRNQSGDQVGCEEVPCTLAVATAVYDYLTTTTDLGISVRDWITQTFPKIRIVSAPELNAASGGLNVAYLYADKVEDNSTDGGATFIQPVASKFYVVGVSQQTKGMEEDYSNSTAGVICKRPFAVYRVQGV